MNVFLQQNELMFNVSYDNRPVIENSSLGIIMDNCPYGKNIKSFSETESSDESIRSYLANGVHHSFYVDVKEFDDGIAFRYRIPANGPKVSMEKALLLFSRQIQLHGMQVDRFSMDGTRFIRNVKLTASKENSLLLPLRS